MGAASTQPVVIDGSPLSISALCRAASATRIPFRAEAGVAESMQASVDLVKDAVDAGQTIYGLTTGFGGMAGVAVSSSHAAASQNNLLSFLAAGAGSVIDRRHVRAAMLLRANVLAQGCSGVRFEIVQRLLRFLQADATPLVRELGSIGASGDLVPLSTIGRAIIGNAQVRVGIGDQVVDGQTALQSLELQPIDLLPKEGLAIVNGTSFSSADSCQLRL